MDYRETALKYAQEYGIPPVLFQRLVQQESGWDPNAVSPVGAQGLTQIMPQTGADPGFGVAPVADINNTDEQLRFGAEYLRAMLDRYDGNQTKALAAYNWGAGNVDNWDGNINSLPAETRGYLNNIMQQKVGPQATRGASVVADVGGFAGEPQPSAGRSRAGKIADAIALGANELRGRNRSDAIPAMVARRQNEAAQGEQKNKTVEWLRSRGRDDLANAVSAGAITGKDAFNVAYQEGRGAATKGVEVDGKLVNPLTGEVIYAGDQKSSNATVQYLRDNGSESLATLVEAGEMTGMDAMRMHQDKAKNSTFRTLTQEEVADLGLDPAKAYQVDTGTKKVSQIGGNGVTVNTNLTDTVDEAFSKEMGKQFATQMSELSEDGRKAQADLAQVEVMTQLLDGVGGTADAWKAWAQDTFNVSIAGGKVEALQAALNQLIPANAPPGVMSDGDIALLKSSFPQLVNSPEGNAIIADTMRGLTQYRIDQARIANALMTGQISKNQAVQMLGNMPDPLAGVKERIASYEDSGAIAAPMTRENALSILEGN